MRAAHRLAAFLALLLALIASMAEVAVAQTQKKYLREDLASDGQRLEERLKREVSAIGQPATLLQDAQRALNAGNPRRALQLASSAVVIDGRLVGGWRLIAKASLAIEPRDYRERWELIERATVAAYLSYERAVDRVNEAAGLAVLGEVFVVRELWRPALTVYRLSLEANEVADVRATYDKLREERGFRLIEHKVDADLASPRACFVFSEPVARGRVDFAQFFQVTGGAGGSGRPDFAIAAEERQICVEGLRHGERYAVTVRAGLPSVYPDERLHKASNYDIYVRDRAPSARFTGRNYVLPRTGQQGIPVVSINTDRLEIEVMRIGDRNLIGTVHSSDFLTQLSGYDAQKIADERGTRIWTGTMDVRNELNQDVTTAFPVVETVGDLQPGIYLMFAKPAGLKSDDDDVWQPRATQWFVVSDLGLTAFTGADGVHVLVRSLSDARPVSAVTIRLLARNNEILGEARTDAAGYARFDGGLARGQGGMAPGLIQASAGPDHGFLDLKQSAFDFSDRGVTGRVAPASLDAFVAAERGVYRSGETVHLTTLLRDPRGVAVTGLPLVTVIRRPDGVEYLRRTVEDQGGGGRALSTRLLPGAATGTWRVLVYSDPKRDPIGETSFLVEDYVPEKLELELRPRTQTLAAGQPAEIDVTARYLYGAPGAELDVSGTIKTQLSARGSAIRGFEGFEVGLSDEEFNAVEQEIEDKVQTGANGRALLAASIPEPATSRPVEAEIAVRVAEPGGRAITRTVTLPIVPRGLVIGVRKGFGPTGPAVNQPATFDVIVATGGDGRRVERSGASALKWQISRIITNYQWMFVDGRWSFEPLKTTRRVADGTLDVGTADPGRISQQLGWGRYRLDVTAEGGDGAETSVTFTVGYEPDASADTPDVLNVALDKNAYAAGERMQIRIAPRFAGQATVAIVGDRLLDMRTVEVAESGATVEVPVGAEWGASAYAVVLAHRPLDQAARRLPGRAIGLAWFTVDKAARTLRMTVDTPATMRPRQPLDIPVRVEGLEPGEQAHVTIAAVDVGILNLTRYQAPNPTEHFFGQRQLGHEVRDLYGLLIDGMQGTRGQVRSGGDAAAPGLVGDIPREAPLAFYSGIMRVGPDGTARATFGLPAFNGTVRVMAMAWSPRKTGAASKDVVVRDPVVAEVTLPRFLGIGDRSRLHLAINNVEGPAGDYTVDVDGTGPIRVDAAALRRTIRLAANGRAEVSVPVTAAGAGDTRFEVRLSGPNGLDLRQTQTLRTQPSIHTVANRTIVNIEPGRDLEITADRFLDMVPGSARLAVSVSPLAALDVPGILKALDRYPYGCTEQTISRALPLLYVNRLASMEQLALDGTAEERVNAAIERTLARQGANGSFGLWGVGGDDLWLDAFAADFLTRAREQRVAVPAVAYTLAIDRLRNQVVNISEIRREEGPAIAYAAYVLARNGRPILGDVRTFVDTRLNEFTTPLARAQLAAALAILGDRTRARTAFQSALQLLAGERESTVARPDYGSRLRDAVGILTLLAETRQEPQLIQRAAQIVEASRNVTRLTSTQEQMWMVMAAQALAEERGNLNLVVNGQERSGSYYRTIAEEDVAGRPLVIGNRGQATARAVLTLSGVPVTAETEPPISNQGFEIQRQIYTTKGQPVQPAQFRQTERYVVVLRVTERSPAYGRVLVVDPVPAGLEIENPRLTEGAALDGLPWLREQKIINPDVQPDHVEARDDRFVAAFTRSGREQPLFTAAYLVRAVSPGQYVHPAAIVEDMYRPDRLGRTVFGSVGVQPAR